MLVRMIECVQGSVQVEVVCEPMFDYGRKPGAWEMSRRRLERRGGDLTPRPRCGSHSDLRIGIEGGRARAATRWPRASGGTSRSGGRTAGGPDATRGRVRPDRGDRALLARLAGRGALPGPSLAQAPASLGAHAQGPHLRADRRDRRRRDDLAARDPGGRAQLGLPLLLDARRDVHALGAARARVRLGGRRLHAVRRRPRARRGRRAADHVRASVASATWTRTS